VTVFFQSRSICPQAPGSERLARSEIWRGGGGFFGWATVNARKDFCTSTPLFRSALARKVGCCGLTRAGLCLARAATSSRLRGGLAAQNRPQDRMASVPFLASPPAALLIRPSANLPESQPELFEGVLLGGWLPVRPRRAATSRCCGGRAGSRIATRGLVGLQPRIPSYPREFVAGSKSGSKSANSHFSAPLRAGSASQTAQFNVD